MSAPVCSSRSGGRPYALVWSPIPFISWLMPFIGHVGICSSTGCTYDFAGPYTVNEDHLLFGRPTRYLALTLDPTSSKTISTIPPSTPLIPHSARGALSTDPEVALTTAAAEADVLVGSRSSGTGISSSLAAQRWAPGGGPHGSMHMETRQSLSNGGDGGRVGGESDGSGTMTSAVAASWDYRLGFAATTYRLLNYNIMTNNCHCFVAHFLNQLQYRGGGWNMVNLAVLVFLRGRYTSLGGLLHTWLPWVLLVVLGAYFGQLTFLLMYVGVCVPLLAWFLFYTWCCWRDLSFY